MSREAVLCETFGFTPDGAKRFIKISNKHKWVQDLLKTSSTTEEFRVEFHRRMAEDIRDPTMHWDKGNCKPRKRRSHRESELAKERNVAPIKPHITLTEALERERANVVEHENISAAPPSFDFQIRKRAKQMGTSEKTSSSRLVYREE